MKKVLRVTTTFSLAALLTFSSLMSPVVAAYGLNEAKPAEAVTDVASAGDDGVAARGDDVEAAMPPSTSLRLKGILRLSTR